MSFGVTALFLHIKFLRATFIKRGFSILWLLAATVSFARQGVVETRDGKSYEGQIRLHPNQVLIANAARDFVVRVELTNL